MPGTIFKNLFCVRRKTSELRQFMQCTIKKRCGFCPSGINIYIYIQYSSFQVHVYTIPEFHIFIQHWWFCILIQIKCVYKYITKDERSFARKVIFKEKSTFKDLQSIYEHCFFVLKQLGVHLVVFYA